MRYLLTLQNDLDMLMKFRYTSHTMNTVKHILTCAGLALVVTSCSSNLTPQPGSSGSVSSAPSSANGSERAVAERIFALVNSERAGNGKKALRGHPGLNNLAQRHSAFLAQRSGDTNHMGSQNRAQFAYLKHNIENLSEMTYAVPPGSGDAASTAVNAWKNSSSHRRHMLQSWDVTGVGVKKGSNGTTYVTMCVGAMPTGVPRSVQPVGW